MGSAFEDTVLDFDLNFLQQPSNIVNDCRIDKQRKAILIAKKKTVATDSLIKKYFAKKEKFEQTEVLLLAAKEECKQVCIDYKESLERCAQLEKDVQSLQNQNKDLQLTCEMTQNHVEAIRSHTHQLQVLVKENETVIDSLKLENQLKKDNAKDCEKNLLNLQKENETLLNDFFLLRDIVLGKKKLHKRHKLLLQKYDKSRSTCDVDDCASESSSDEKDLLDSSLSSPLFTPFGITEDKSKVTDIKINENIDPKKESTRINKDYDSDCSNERVSEDTGCGSSLEFSDGEKCFNSPDYFSNDSPIAQECNKIKDTRVFVDTCTSPVTIHEMAHIATSPLLFDDEALLSDNNTFTPIEQDSDSTEYFITDIPLSTEIVTLKERKKMVDVGTSTDTYIEKLHVSTSPIVFQELDLVHKEYTHSATSPIPIIQSNPICNINNVITASDVSTVASSDVAANKVIENKTSCTEIRHTIVENLSSQSELEISGKSLEEKQCLERNNSEKLASENCNDVEIEMILNSMRLTERLITPIPKTPVKISKKVLSPDKQKKHLYKEHTACKEAIRLREENKVLHTSIADLSKDINNIKSILKKQRLMPESPKKHVTEINNIDIINSQLFDSSQEETIFVHVDGETNRSNHSNHNDKIDDYDLSNNSKNNEISISPPTVENSNNKGPVIQNIKVLPAGSQVWKEMSSSAEGNFEIHKSSETLLSEVNTESKAYSDSNYSGNVSVLESRKNIENNLRMESEETFECDNITEIILNGKKHKNVKHKKLSRLDKFRKKLLPKSKIKKINLPIRKLHSKSKLKPIIKSKNLEAELLLNNKSAYEKALKVMTDLKLKKVHNEKKSVVKDVGKNIEEEKIHSDQKESNNNSIESRRNSNEIYLSKNKIPFEIKQPIICLSPLNLDSTRYIDTQKAAVNQSPSKSQTTSPRKSDRILSTDSSQTKNFSPRKSDKTLSTDSSSTKNFSPRKSDKTLSTDSSSTKNFSPRKSDNTLSTDSSPAKNFSPRKSDKTLSTDSSPTNNFSPRKSDKTLSTDSSPAKNFSPRKSDKTLSTDLSSTKNFSPRKSDNILSTDSSPAKNFSPRKSDKTLSTVSSPTNNFSPRKSDKTLSTDSSPAKNFSPRKSDKTFSTDSSPVKNFSPRKSDKTLSKDSSPIKNFSPRKSVKILYTDSSPTKNFINTRSRSKCIQDSITSIPVNTPKDILEKSEEFTKECIKPIESRKRLKRVASNSPPPVECKRILRSRNIKEIIIDQLNAKEECLTTNNILTRSNSSNHKRQLSEEDNKNQKILNTDISKSSECIGNSINTSIENNNNLTCSIINPRESILCKMIEKFGKVKIKYGATKIPDAVSDSICKKIEENIAKIIELPVDKTKSAMNKLVEQIRYNWSVKIFFSGFIKYLKDPDRKQELFNRVNCPPAPPMTKSEQILLYVMRQLEMCLPNTVSTVLTQIEFTLFHLNKTPEFDVIESMSHFYALLCRYFGFKSRLRQFILDAMYCLQFKVVPLIKQCLDVWMHILPLAHMGIAKTPLVTCLVYLLHFYKCEDKFNRVQDIRVTLSKKYFYQITDWNETKILDMFRNAIKDIREIKVEKKMLRMAFIILAKRQGPKWCQKNLIKNMLLPLIEKEDVPLRVKQFSVELLGPLLKPYPTDMKVHCEIVVNQLLDMLEQNIPDCMKEAILTSLIYTSKHNKSRVTKSLLSWSPTHVSPEFEELMKDFVQEKPLKAWKTIILRSDL